MGIISVLSKFLKIEMNMRLNFWVHLYQWAFQAVSWGKKEKFVQCLSLWSYKILSSYITLIAIPSQSCQLQKLVTKSAAYSDQNSVLSDFFPWKRSNTSWWQKLRMLLSYRSAKNLTREAQSYSQGNWWHHVSIRIENMGYFHAMLLTSFHLALILRDERFR